MNAAYTQNTRRDEREQAVLAATSRDEPLTVMDIAARAFGRDSWAQRGNVRNDLYALEAQGLVVCNGKRPMKFVRR